MTLLALERETIMIFALASLTVAGVVFAGGALVLFTRERRAARQRAGGTTQDPLQESIAAERDPADGSTNRTT
jgi:hypothetical protein